jgi:hypothetical protein
MSQPDAEAVVRDYFSRLKRALASLPMSRRNQLIGDLREHVAAAREGCAEDTPASVGQILERLGDPAAIAAAAIATDGSRRGSRRIRSVMRTRGVAIPAVAIVFALIGGTLTVVLGDGHAAPTPAVLTSVKDANSDCSPPTNPTTSGGAASTVTGNATEVANGTVNGNSWSLWSAHGQSGANGLEQAGLVIDGHGYGLCPGFPNPAELELADIGSQAIVYGVVGYPGKAKIQLYTSTVGTFDRGHPLPSPTATIVNGVSFFIGALPGSACDYPSLELNTTSPGVSAEHNLGFGTCASGKLVTITASQGIWQLPAGQFPANFGNGPGTGPGVANVPMANSDCSPATDAATSGGPASTVTSNATEVASGTVDGNSWSLWSAHGRSGANGLEQAGLVIDGHGYGLCPGYPNPAELELADIGSQAIVYGVVGYHGKAKIQLYSGTAGSFVPGKPLPTPAVRLVNGVSFFIGALPGSACGYPAFELNTTSPGVSDEHNLGFGTCTAGKLVTITWSQGIWQLPPGQFPDNFRTGPGIGPGPGIGRRPNSPPNSDCSPATDAATSGGPASTVTSKATEVASGTVNGNSWSLWSAHGQSGANGLEQAGLVIDGHGYGLCPGYPNPAELELADIGSQAIVYGVIGYPGLARVQLYTSTAGTFDTGASLPTPAVQVANGVSFFIGTLPRSACDYPSLELNSTAKDGNSQHNLGFGSCKAGQLVPITESQGEWTIGAHS